MRRSSTARQFPLPRHPRARQAADTPGPRPGPGQGGRHAPLGAGAGDAATGDAATDSFERGPDALGTDDEGPWPGVPVLEVVPDISDIAGANPPSSAGSAALNPASASDADADDAPGALDEYRPVTPAVAVASSTPGTGSGCTRRALVTTVAAGVAMVACAGGTRLLVPVIEQRATSALGDGFWRGFAAGRQALLNELRDLEGVSLDAAIEVAEVTQAAVQTIVVPLAQLDATIGGDALGIVEGALDDLIAGASVIPWLQDHLDPLRQLRHVMAEWRSGVGTLPLALAAYATADVTRAEEYLQALRRQVTQDGDGTQEPSSTSTNASGSHAPAPLTAPVAQGPSVAGCGNSRRRG